MEKMIDVIKLSLENNITTIGFELEDKSVEIKCNNKYFIMEVYYDVTYSSDVFTFDSLDGLLEKLKNF